jgi:putative flavoprotein involved in K+ transport
MILLGLAEHTPADLQDPNEMYTRQPQASGTRGGHSVSLHQLAREGAQLLGRLSGVRGQRLAFAADLLSNVQKGEELSARLEGGIEMFLEKTGTAAPPAELDPADSPFGGLGTMAAVRELDLEAKGIRSVIWATGFGPNFDYLDGAWLDERGLPRHSQGVCEVAGLYCVGLMWLRRRISGLLAGVDRDAEYISELIAQRS